MLFILLCWCCRSDYASITDADRVTELIKDIGLDSKWKLDEVMVSAIAFILKKWNCYIKTI
jgi:hypothetical protein